MGGGGGEGEGGSSGRKGGWRGAFLLNIKNGSISMAVCHEYKNLCIHTFSLKYRLQFCTKYGNALQ